LLPLTGTGLEKLQDYNGFIGARMFIVACCIQRQVKGKVPPDLTGSVMQRTSLFLMEMIKGGKKSFRDYLCAVLNGYIGFDACVMASMLNKAFGFKGKFSGNSSSTKLSTHAALTERVIDNFGDMWKRITRSQVYEQRLFYVRVVDEDGPLVQFALKSQQVRKKKKKNYLKWSNLAMLATNLILLQIKAQVMTRVLKINQKIK
jgi:hypothetical protein